MLTNYTFYLIFSPIIQFDLLPYILDPIFFFEPVWLDPALNSHLPWNRILLEPVWLDSALLYPFPFLAPIGIIAQAKIVLSRIVLLQ